MKIRNGFVSNSSSSSFLIYGIYLDDSSELLRLHNEGRPDEEKVEDRWNLYSKGLEIENMDYGGTYVGLSWDSVKNDETGKEFKERAEKLIKELLPGYTGKFGTHEEAWYG